MSEDLEKMQEGEFDFYCDNYIYCLGKDYIIIYKQLGQNYANGHGASYTAKGKKTVEVYKWMWDRDYEIEYKAIDKDLNEIIRQTIEKFREAQSISDKKERFGKQTKILNNFKDYITLKG